MNFAAIQDQLDKTDILIIVYTGRSKSSHSWTGWELGYFMHVIRDSPNEPPQNADHRPLGHQRRVVSFYRNEPPPAAAGIHGIPFDIGPEDLALTDEEYEQKISSIDTSSSIVNFFQSMEAEVDSIRQTSQGSRPPPRDIRHLLSCVQVMLKGVFAHLKQSIDIDVNPQKKIIVEVTGELQRDAMELPGEAQLVPAGSGAMEIFGLPSTPISWADFLRRAPDKYRLTWKDVIETVIIYSVPNRLDVDNSQIVVSIGEVQIYRVVLSRSIRYLTEREFHFYFVESLTRGDYGNRLTTLLLKGLELACRFRFMFFERASPFASRNLSLAVDKKYKQNARDLVRELNLLQRDATAARLDEPLIWLNMVEYKLLEDCVKEYYPSEGGVRVAAAAVISAPEPPPREVWMELLESVKSLEGAMEALNLTFIRALAEKLQHIDKLPGGFVWGANHEDDA